MASKGAVSETERLKSPPLCGVKGCQGCSWIFTGLEAKGQQELQKLMRSVEYGADEAIFHEGTPAFGFFIICTGKAKLIKQGPGGKRQILKIVGPGELLGEENLFEGGTHTASARTLEPTRARFIKREDFLDFLKRHPSVALQLSEKIARELQGFQAKLIETAYESCRARLARLLLALAEKYGTDASGREIQAQISRTDLAEMAGISTETAIRTLGEFEEKGLVSLKRRKITIVDRLGLEKLAAPRTVETIENLL